MGAALDLARRRTLELVAGVPADQLDVQHTPLMSPLSWDLGHIAAFEELWICRATPGLEPLRADLFEVYDAAETPRARRGDLPYLHAHEARDYMDAVRARSLEALEGADLREGLNARGLVWHLVIQHEHQHNETMLQALQLAEPGTYAPPRVAPPASDPGAGPDMVAIEAGQFVMGASGEGFAYDNEKPAHEVDLPAFSIDRSAVTCGAYLTFLEDGGYRRRELWSEAGWAWREQEGIERPLFWTAGGQVRSFERIEPVDSALPVTNVSFFEAEAFARWRGARLPTEAEWERAATWHAGTATKRAYPWGEEPPTPERANLGARAFGTAPAAGLSAGASPEGVLGLVGDSWEWVSDEFDGYPGFRAHPYREYSEIFFGRGLRCLRGGSWSTHEPVARPTFRNWDHPQRRQIFSGFRCARDEA